MSSKVYVDCGLIYHEGWINVDAMGDKTPIGKPRHGVRTCDQYKLPKDGDADIVRMVRVFERIKQGDPLSELLADVEQTLRPGGIFNLIVPKHDEVEDLWMAQRVLNPELVFGPLENNYTRYMFKYSADAVIKLVIEHGLDYLGDSDAFKDYPCYELLFRKPYPPAARDYIKLPEIPAGAQVLDIGPGNFPLPIATHYLDVTDRHFKKMSPDLFPGQKIVGNIENPTQFSDKQFDFIYAAHVFEHLADPAKAAAEVSRIGKAGVMICPGPHKEFMFGYEEDEHKWDIYGPRKDGESVVFVGRDTDFVKRFSEDKDYQSIMAGLFRSGRFDFRERRYLRNWYRRNEKYLDVVVFWNDALRLEVRP